MDQDRFRNYVKTQRKTQRFQRWADVVFLGIVLVSLAGSAVGLLPELEKSDQLDEKIALEQELVEAEKAKLRQMQRRLHLLRTDVPYMEQELRNRSPRAAKPGETLLMVPPERRAIYEAADPE